MAAAALGEASDTMMAHPLALQLRNLQTLVELGVEKNTTIVFPAPLMSAIGELGTFLARESAAAVPAPQPVTANRAGGSTQPAHPPGYATGMPTIPVPAQHSRAPRGPVIARWSPDIAR